MILTAYELERRRLPLAEPRVMAQFSSTGEYSQWHHRVHSHAWPRQFRDTQAAWVELMAAFENWITENRK